VEGANIILESKIDGLRIHAACKKHCKVEKVYASIPIDLITTIVSRAVEKRKEVQIAVLFHLLRNGRPMVEYEGMRNLLGHLEVPKLPKKH
jgi:hypothetical protein